MQLLNILFVVTKALVFIIASILCSFSKFPIAKFACVTDVYFREISDDDIEWYVSHEENLLKKAGYSLEGIMSLFLERLDGDYYNVLGLPLGELYKGINELGYSLKDLD